MQIIYYGVFALGAVSHSKYIYMQTICNNSVILLTLLNAVKFHIHRTV